MFESMNTPAIQYWRATGYSAQDVWQVGKEIDGRFMAALVTFNCGEVQLRVSNSTWTRQEGHYPTIGAYFQGIANHPKLANKSGVLLVWLEDGMWLPEAHLARRAPILAFGKHFHDPYTALIPDPAFIAEIAYGTIIAEHDRFASIIPWHERIGSLYWRGAATGECLSIEQWRESPRCRLALHGRDLADASVLDARITKCSHLPEELQASMHAEGILAAPVPFTTFLGYKYLIDIDGYACAWKSLFLKLASGSVTLKVNSPLEQWYFRNLTPWKHYIPVSGEPSELREIHSWLLAHDESARQMTLEARAFTDSVTFGDSFEAVVDLCADILECQLPASEGIGVEGV
jgi:Glycosyl transferase family 90